MEKGSAPGEQKPNPTTAPGEQKPNPPTATGDRKPKQQNIPTKNQRYEETRGMEFQECRHLLPEGLTYIPNFISAAEEQDVMQYIDSKKWSDDLWRRS